MTDDFLHNEGNKLVKALPIYLAVQAAILLMTFLELPVYWESYLDQHDLAVSGWLGAWFVLTIIGVTLGLALLISKTWRKVFSQTERGKLAGGYFLGAIAGLLTLGLRFQPVMPVEYFLAIGGLVLVLSIAYFVWKRRQPKLDEIFP